MYILNSIYKLITIRSSCTHPRVIDAGDALLRPVQHQEGSQVSSVGSHNDHSESSPDHSQNSCREAARRTFEDSKY